MAVIRELVTRLRYEVDQRGLNGYRLAIQGVADKARKATQEVRESADQAGNAYRQTGNAATAMATRVSRALSLTSNRIAQTAREARNLNFSGMTFTPATSAMPRNQRVPRMVDPGQVQPMLEALKRGETDLSRFARKTGAVSEQFDQVRRSAEGVRRKVESVGREWRDTGRQVRQANRQVRQHGREAREATDAVGSLQSLWFAIGGTFAAISLGRMSDEYKSVNNQLSAILDSQQQVAQAEDAINQAAENSRAGYGTTAELFASIQRGAHLYNLEMQDTVQLTETINKLMAMGKSGPGAQAALIQFTQAIASGELRGQELRSVMEQSQPLAMAVAEAVGVTQDRLLEMGEQGELKISQILKGLLAQTDEVNAKFESFQWTFAQAFTHARRELTVFIGEADRKLGFTGWLIGRFIDSVDMLVGALRGLVNAGIAGFGWLAEAVGGAENAARLLKFMLIAAIGPGALKMVGKMIAGMRRMAAAAWASAGPWALIAGAILAALLIGEDIVAWANGAESVFGRLVGPFSEWKEEIEGIKTAFDNTIESIKTMVEPITSVIDELDLLDGAFNAIEQNFTAIDELFTTLFAGMLNTVETLIENLGYLAAGLGALATGNFSKAWDKFGKLGDNSQEFAEDAIKGTTSLLGVDNFLIRKGSPLDKFVNYLGEAFSNPRTTTGYAGRIASQGVPINSRGGDVVVNQTNNITTASGSPTQVGAAVGRATQGAARGIPRSPGSVERAP